MADYEPEYVYMTQLRYKTKETYYETIDTVPVKMKGAIIIDEDKEDHIDFQIIDPYEL